MSSCMCVDRAVRSELVDFKTDVLVCQTVAEPVRLESALDLSVADMNGDGNINNFDALLIARRVLGIG